MAGYFLWLFGNVVLPLTPLLAIRAAGWLMRREVTREDLLGDGILFFYNTTLASLFLIDVWKDSLTPHPRIGQAVVGSAVTFGVSALVLNAICYMILTLIRIGKLQGFRARELMNLSWIATLVVASLTVVFRFVTRVY